MQSTASPPTTPPTIAPILVFEPPVSFGRGDELASAGPTCDVLVSTGLNCDVLFSAGPDCDALVSVVKVEACGADTTVIDIGDPEALDKNSTEVGVSPADVSVGSNSPKSTGADDATVPVELDGAIDTPADWHVDSIACASFPISSDEQERELHDSSEGQTVS